jgi:hypothetical protein
MHLFDPPTLPNITGSSERKISCLERWIVERKGEKRKKKRDLGEKGEAGRGPWGRFPRPLPPGLPLSLSGLFLFSFFYLLVVLLT